MKFTRATDYALFVTTHLAGLEPDESISTRAVACKFNIPERFLANIVHKLAKNGIIVSLKGVNGGIKLARDASQITMLEVVEVMEKSLALVKCQSEAPHCPLESNCTMKGFMDNIYREMRDSLNLTTIDNLRFSADGRQHALE